MQTISVECLFTNPNGFLPLLVSCRKRILEYVYDPVKMLLFEYTPQHEALMLAEIQFNTIESYIHFRSMEKCATWMDGVRLLNSRRNWDTLTTLDLVYLFRIVD